LLLQWELQRPDVSSLQAFRALFDGEFNLLALGKSLIATHLDGRKMDENVWAAFALDKAKTLAAVEPLDDANYTFAHVAFTPGGYEKRMRWKAAFLPTKKARQNAPGFP
jgi:hypothetical protein